MRGHKVYVKKSIDEALAHAAQSDCLYSVNLALGGFFSGRTEFFAEIMTWIRANPDFYLIGHLLDRKDRWYEIHEQSFAINMQVYRQLGCPQFGKEQVMTAEMPAVERSTENFHDDYTPFWLKPAAGSVAIHKAKPGHGLISAGIRAGHTLHAFPQVIRDSKYFFYPTTRGEFSRKFARWEMECQSSIESFYTFNTESIKNVADGINPRPLGRLITLCSGLLFFEILKKFDFIPGTKVNFYDTSEMALHMMKCLTEKWDGRNYPRFVQDNAWARNRLFNFWDAEKKWSDFLQKFGGEEKWLEFFARVKRDCHFNFSRRNVFQDEFANHPYFECLPEHGETLLWLSNVFHYRYTSSVRNLNDRLEAQDKLLRDLKARVPKMLVYMTSALGSRSKLGEIIFVEDYKPESQLAPSFWVSISSRYPENLRQFLGQHKDMKVSPPVCPPQFRDIDLDNLDIVPPLLLSKYSQWIEKQSLLPWLRLDLTLDHATMLSEARGCLDKFVDHRSDYSEGWSSVCLHGVSSHQTEDYDKYGFAERKDVPYKWTEVSERCPVTTKWLQTEWPMESFDRVRFMLLKPGGYILPHNDMGGVRGLSATNVSLNHPDNCEMVFARHGTLPWEPGQVFRLDVGVDHAVFNGSDDLRFHMIIHGRIGKRKDDWDKLIIRSYLKQFDVVH